MAEPSPAERRAPAGQPGTILLLGATGTVGKQVGRALAGRRGVRALVHSERSEEALAGTGFELVRGDLDDPASLREACAEVARLLIVAPSGPGHADRELAAIRAATEAGSLEHVVKVSSLAAAADPVPAIARSHAMVERQISSRPYGVTLLRPSSFVSNLVANREEIAAGRIWMPAGEARMPFVDPRDIGQIAAAALTSTAPPLGPVEVTGPEPLGFADLAGKLTDALGHPVAYEDADPEEWCRRRTEAGLPAALARAVVESLAEPPPHRAPLGEAQHRMLGRPARSFETWLAEEGTALLGS